VNFPSRAVFSVVLSVHPSYVTCVTFADFCFAPRGTNISRNPNSLRKRHANNDTARNFDASHKNVSYYAVLSYAAFYKVLSRYSAPS